MKVRIGQRKTSSNSTVSIPAGKSTSHRVLIAASLAKGRSLIRNISQNDDVFATSRCLREAGTVIVRHDNSAEVFGLQNPESDREILLDAGESGSTLRFLIPVLMNEHRTCVWTGHGRLMERPMDIYEELFEAQKIQFRKEGKIWEIRGRLRPGEYVIPGNVSSQFISGLLFELPRLAGDSVIRITGKFESQSYVRLTEKALSYAGITVKDEGNIIHIPGNQVYKPFETTVDGDDSSAAFFGVLAAITGKPVTVLGIAHDSVQPDHVIFEILKRAGLEVLPVEDGYKFLPGKELKPLKEDLSDCPDLGPALFALATMIPGKSEFTGTARLRFKESDRIASMKEELGKLGCKLTDMENSVTVYGGSKLHGNVSVESHNDHRIVMAMSVLASALDEPVDVDGADCVSKSFPEFFNRLEKAGVEVTYYD